MSRTRSGRVEEIFLLAIDRDPAEWRALLDRECAGDKELRSEVEDLLKHHADTDEFMDSKAAPGRGLMTQIGVAAGSPEEDLKLPEDRMIGRYRVIERLGAGGMGIVYLAEQDRPKRTVALKVMRLGHSSARMLRRFEYEAEVLGRLHHPGIAQVYEAGAWTQEGATRPFIAMELVRGLPIGRHCEEKGLGVRDRLELVAMACDAVQHAHQAGVIHRDLKPGNILVNTDGQVKLLDFGVARPLQNDLQLTTSMTGLGALIGTLPYMSPEQVLGDPNAIDTRSDVYALGVIMYELLSGRLPYDIRSRSLPEAARIIRDEEPAKLSGVDRVFKGEIETIVGQALEKDPARRYQSAAELGEDIRRYLEGRPILARNSSRWYVVQKQLHRHRGWVAAGAAGLLGLISFSIYATLQAQRERDARLDAQGNLIEAERQKKIARETSDRLAAELRVSSIENAKLRSRTGDLAAAEKMLWQEHLKDPSSPHTSWGLWEMYHDHATILAGKLHDPGVVVGVLSPSGEVLATGGVDTLVKLWRASDMTLIGTMPGHAAGARVTSMSYSPDGALLVSSGDDRQIQAHDVRTGSIVGTYSARSPVRRAAVSRDGTRVVFSEDSGFLSVLSLPRCELVWERKLPAASATVNWDLADARVLAGCDDGFIRAFSPAGEPVGSLSASTEGPVLQVRTLAIDPASGTLATSARDRTIRTFRPDLSGQVGVAATPNGAISEMSFTGDGRRLVAGGWWRLEVLNAATMQFERAFTAPTTITSVSLTGDNRYAYCGLSNGEVRVWELERGGVHALPGHEGRVVGTYSPDGRLLFTGDSRGVLRVWDAVSLRLLARRQAHARRIMTIVFTPDGSGVITGADDRLLKVWDMATGELKRQHSGLLEESCNATAVSPDGRLIATAEIGGLLVVRDLATWEVLGSMPKHGYGYIAARFSADGAYLYGTNRDRGAYVMRLDGFTNLPAPAPDMSQPWAVASPRGGGPIVTSTWSKEIQVRDPVTLRVDHVLEGHTGLVSSVEFSPTDKRLLLSTSTDGTMRLWDMAERREVLLTRLGQSGVEGISARFSPNGAAIIAAGSLGLASVFDLSYYQRAIANHAELALGREGLGKSEDPRVKEFRAWAASVIAKPWPALGPAAQETPEQRAAAEAASRAWSK